MGCYGGAGTVAQRFTGKERHGETGLDYFLARYYSGAQGRFSSLDAPFVDQRASDPQSWNHYVYGRNNPLLYADPTGESVEITSCGNSNDCVQAIRAATGSSAAESQVQMRTEVEPRGWFGRLLGLKPNERSYIEITGDVQAFRATSENASRLADVVGSTQNVQFALTAVGSPKNVSFDLLGGGDLVLRPGGATSRVLSQNFYPAVFVHPGSANYQGDPTSQALGIPAANRAERTAHELLGHVWADISRGMSGMINGQPNPQNTEAAVRAENNVRSVQPGRGVKTRH